MWTLKTRLGGKPYTAIYHRWSQALAHAIDAMRSAADDVDGLDPTNCEYDEWRAARWQFRDLAPHEPFTITDPSGNVYTVVRAE